VFTSRIEEAVFDVKINPIQREAARIATPAASESFALVVHGCHQLIATLPLMISSLPKKRRASLPRLGSAQVRRGIEQA